MAQVLSEQLLGPERATDETTLLYIEYLSKLKVDVVQNVEPQDTSQASHSLLLSIQALSKKSRKCIVESAFRHSFLCQTLPSLVRRANDLAQIVPRLDQEAELFSTEFNKNKDNTLIQNRKKALRLLHNSERLVGVLEIPPLLMSAISSSPVNYSSTLDLYAHVQRLASLHPSSSIVSSVRKEAEVAVRQMAVDLIFALKLPNLKLATGLRTVGWLKRIVTDSIAQVSTEEALSATFLVCRLSTLILTLDALNPLKELADQESQRNAESAQSWAGGQHTERYLKRFTEVFREHSFGIVSMAKSIGASFPHPSKPQADLIYPLPLVLASFPLHLTGLLTDKLQMYLPNLKDKAARESILTQVLYCAGSLSRLGADFSMSLSFIGTSEWTELVKRHRLLAGRLESVIGDYRGR